jgi:hypothetical protein
VANATLADLEIANNDGFFFTADILGTNGNTGPVASTGTVTVPAPPIGRGLPVLLAVGGLLFGARRWERSKASFA